MNGMGWDSWDLPKNGRLQCSNADVALTVWSYLNFICGIVRAHMEEVSFNSKIAWECWIFGYPWIFWISNHNPDVPGY